MRNARATDVHRVSINESVVINRYPLDFSFLSRTLQSDREVEPSFQLIEFLWKHRPFCILESRIMHLQVGSIPTDVLFGNSIERSDESCCTTAGAGFSWVASDTILGIFLTSLENRGEFDL